MRDRVVQKTLVNLFRDNYLLSRKGMKNQFTETIRRRQQRRDRVIDRPQVFFYNL
jgi:hypothetical protein